MLHYFKIYYKSKCVLFVFRNISVIGMVIPLVPPLAASNPRTHFARLCPCPFHVCKTQCRLSPVVLSAQSWLSDAPFTSIFGSLQSVCYSSLLVTEAGRSLFLPPVRCCCHPSHQRLAFCCTILSLRK